MYVPVFVFPGNQKTLLSINATNTSNLCILSLTMSTHRVYTIEYTRRYHRVHSNINMTQVIIFFLFRATLLKVKEHQMSIYFVESL